ncbi:MAG: amidohydrolase family protein [Bryobacterales bacterium]|nr:amidohydrolase family protein [Bryobacterales bacterium]
MKQAALPALLLPAAAMLALFAPPAVESANTPDFERIDAHAHLAPPPPQFLQMLDRQRIRILNVTLIDPQVPGFDTPEPQASWAAKIALASGGRIAWTSPFDPTGFAASGWARREIHRLSADMHRGAVAVKMYKPIGLCLKDAAGKYVLPDDPVFSPPLEAIAAGGATLLAHLSEPRSSWRPLDPADPHYGYYQANPDWHMFRYPDRPSWDAIIAARDRMLAAHPSLRVVGCHLGSMEHDVDEVARRLDRYPNFAIDTAARLSDLQRQPRAKVRRFLLKYQDRVLWGTDLLELKWEDAAAATARCEAAYQHDWRYFASELALPPTVLRKIFRDNSLRWIPGLAAGFAPAVPHTQSQPGRPLPAVDQVLSRYLQAMGGERGLNGIATLAATGTVSVVTYGQWGQYREFAKAPRSLRRTFRFPGYASLDRAFNGTRGWEESPEYGVEILSGSRLSAVRRLSEFRLPLTIRAVYPKITVKGLARIDEFDAVILDCRTAAGEQDQLWFDQASGLLLAVDLSETFANGVVQRIRYQFEDYRPVNGVPLAHRIRYESPRMIWVVTRHVAVNVPVDEAVFEPPT